MHLANDPMVSAPAYQPIWKTTRSSEERRIAVSPVVHIATESALRDEIQARVHILGIEVVEDLPSIDTANRRGPHQPACAVIDVDMHDTDVCSLLSTFAGKDNPPVVLIGRCEDPRLLVRAIKLGAFDYFPKPAEVSEIVSTVFSAIDHDRRQAAKRLEEGVLRSRLATLTRREREVLPLVIGGLLNKQAASLLGISEVTLQIHRGQVMRKMQADSLADLVRMCVKMRIPHWHPMS